MRWVPLVLGLTVIAAVAVARVSAKEAPSVKMFEDLTGEDWARLSEQEKQRFVYTAIGALERRGVLIMRSPGEYLDAMEKLLLSDAELRREYLESLFVFCVYDGEPQTRDAIRLIRREASVPGGG
jgi:hypothetical protein